MRNQHLLAQNLADYLPPVSDPRYDEYERNYPKYRKGLEERYPQVCEKCEPKVRERLKITGYAAKTDHLRRMMERTKNTRLAPRMKIGWVWTDLFTYGGAVGWVIALVGQIYWNVMGLLALPEDGLRDNQANLTIPQCLVQAFNAHKVEPICLQTAHTLASFTLVVAFLSLWWNPAMLSGPMRRAGGLGEYYKLQFIINGLRLLVWYVLGRQTELGLEDRIVKAVHATMLIFNLLVSTKNNDVCWN